MENVKVNFEIVLNQKCWCFSEVQKVYSYKNITKKLLKKMLQIFEFIQFVDHSFTMEI